MIHLNLSTCCATQGDAFPCSACGEVHAVENMAEAFTDNMEVERYCHVCLAEADTEARVFEAALKGLDIQVDAVPLEVLVELACPINELGC